MRSFVAIVLVMAVMAFGSSTHDECAVGGELRRNHHCAAVRHTKKDVCCWMKRDGTHGKLPYQCCGTGWETHNCAELVDKICDTHPEDM
jgi:hypothetical protein